MGCFPPKNGGDFRGITIGKWWFHGVLMGFMIYPLVISNSWRTWKWWKWPSRKFVSFHIACWRSHYLRVFNHPFGGAGSWSIGYEPWVSSLVIIVAVTLLLWRSFTVCKLENGRNFVGFLMKHGDLNHSHVSHHYQRGLVLETRPGMEHICAQLCTYMFSGPRML